MTQRPGKSKRPLIANYVCTIISESSKQQQLPSGNQHLHYIAATSDFWPIQLPIRNRSTLTSLVFISAIGLSNSKYFRGRGSFRMAGWKRMFYRLPGKWKSDIPNSYVKYFLVTKRTVVADSTIISGWIFHFLRSLGKLYTALLSALDDYFFVVFPTL